MVDKSFACLKINNIQKNLHGSFWSLCFLPKFWIENAFSSRMKISADRMLQHDKKSTILSSFVKQYQYFDWCLLLMGACLQKPVKTTTALCLISTVQHCQQQLLLQKHLEAEFQQKEFDFTEDISEKQRHEWFNRSSLLTNPCTEQFV